MVVVVAVSVDMIVVCLMRLAMAVRVPPWRRGQRGSGGSSEAAAIVSGGVVPVDRHGHMLDGKPPHHRMFHGARDGAGIVVFHQPHVQRGQPAA